MNQARRTSIVRAGPALAADHLDLLAYRDRRELTGSTGYNGGDMRKIVLLAATLLFCGGCVQRHWPSGVGIVRLTPSGQIIQEGDKPVVLGASHLFEHTISQRPPRAFSLRDDGALLIAWVGAPLQLYLPSDSGYETFSVSSSARAVAWSNTGQRFASVEEHSRLQLIIRTETRMIERNVELWPESKRVPGTTIGILESVRSSHCGCA